MSAVINGFSWLINFFKTIIDFLMFAIKSIITMFEILISIVDIVFGLLHTLPYWLVSFVSITLMISIIYIVVGRQAGKSD